MARKGDGLTQRGKTWYLDCRINGQRYVTRLGKNISRSVAGELASVKRAAVLKGEAGIRKKKDVPFEKAKQAFLDWAITNKRPRTVRVYRQQVERLAMSFGGKTLHQISAFDIERHKRTRTDSGARIQANREVSVLKNVINKAKAWGMFEGENPACAVKLLKEPKRRLRFLDPREEAKLVQVSPSWLGHLITIGCNTGLRIGAELLPLQWPSVDLMRDTVTVEAAYSKNGESRTVPLNSRAKAAFQALFQMRQGPFVFAKPNGTPYKNVEHVFRKACKAAGLAGTGVSLHTLRHTFASNLVMAGVDLVTVQQYGGWSDLSLVQRYAHLSPHHKAKAIERIAESFHNAIHNSPVSTEVVELAERQVTV
jgi:integrase